MQLEESPQVIEKSCHPVRLGEKNIKYVVKRKKKNEEGVKSVYIYVYVISKNIFVQNDFFSVKYRLLFSRATKLKRKEMTFRKFC